MYSKFKTRKKPHRSEDVKENEEKNSSDEKNNRPEKKHHTSKNDGNQRKPITEPNGNRDKRNIR